MTYQRAAFIFGSCWLLCAALGMAFTPQDKIPQPPKQYKTGLKLPAADVRAKVSAKLLARHGARVARLPRVTAASFDCSTAFGNVPGIKDQMQCGSCYVFAAVDAAEMAFIKAGTLSLTGGGMSEQYFLDCKSVGGCDGGWPSEVIELCRTEGVPLTVAYGAYKGSVGTCNAGKTLYPVADWGYCTPGQTSGIASTQDIKNCMTQYGPISVCVDATGFSSYTGGIYATPGTDINHAVILTGWDDARGAWKLRNQWSKDWGEQGYMWIKYGAASVGYDAFWVSAAVLPPPPPPDGKTLKSITLTFSDGSTVTYDAGAAPPVPPDLKGMTAEQLIAWLAKQVSPAK